MEDYIVLKGKRYEILEVDMIDWDGDYRLVHVWYKDPAEVEEGRD